MRCPKDWQGELGDYDIMAYDRFSIVYHLTPHGWQIEENGIVPNDRLLTAELQVYQGSGFGPESRTWITTWTHPSLSSQEIADLEAKFPKPEKSMELSPASLRALRGEG